jgi:hypothetical protein
MVVNVLSTITLAIADLVFFCSDSLLLNLIIRQAVSIKSCIGVLPFFTDLVLASSGCTRNGSIHIAYPPARLGRVQLQSYTSTTNNL